MSVSNLTNTKWVLNSNIAQTTQGYLNANIEFSTHNGTYNYNYFRLGYMAINSQGPNLIPANNCITYDFISVFGDGGPGIPTGWLDQAYRTIEITGGTDVSNPDLIAWLSQNATLQPIKTFDLSTLQLSAGTHTIQVKARATGYRDSNFSNSVSYVVAPQPIDSGSGGSND